MDLAYDRIQKETLSKDDNATAAAASDATAPEPPPSLNDDLQDAYRAFSSSPWGVRIGGFLGSVVKQGGEVYREAQQELSAVGQDATRGFTDLRESIMSRTRSLSLVNPVGSPSSPSPGPGANDDASSVSTNATATAAAAAGGTPTATGRDMSSEDAIKESETVLSRLRGEAAKRLKDLQKAEDAADEALLRLGSNLRDFFKDAIKIAPPADGQAGDASGQGSGRGAGGARGGGGPGSGAVQFESKDAHGKRVIHATRFEAQMHVIHTNTESFTKDPSETEFAAWSKTFDIDKKTEDISLQLSEYPELRATMEKLVPDQIRYADFWKRYYYLRHGIETAEERRKALLKAASSQEEVGWDEDDSDEGDEEAGEGEGEGEDEDEEDSDEDDSDEEESEEESDKTVPVIKQTQGKQRRGSVESSKTIQPPAGKVNALKPAVAVAAAAPTASTAATSTAKPAEPRKSHDEKSQADSDTSYDMVGATSGVPSQAPSSPKDPKHTTEDSDEEDWE